MISTKDYGLLPDRKSLEAVCKAISVLDAIISQEWQDRYYSFNSNWDKNERFREDGCAINGFAHEYEKKDKAKLTHNVPSIFNEFYFGEPVTSIGTTFCLWTTEMKNWQVGQLENFEDNSEEMLSIFEDWVQLGKDMIEIGYSYDFKGGSESQKKSKWKFW